MGAGSSDFLQNYYVNPYINKLYTPDQYGSYLVSIFTSFIKVYMYEYLCVILNSQIFVSNSVQDSDDELLKNRIFMDWEPGKLV